MKQPGNILVAVDGSDHSLNAINYVAGYCSAATYVSLIYVLPKRPEQVFWQVNMDEAFIARMKDKYARWEKEQRDTSMDFLQSARALLVRRGLLESRLQIILADRQLGTASDIVAEAQKGYDALVVGRRGLNKMGSFLLGSVSDKIVELVQDLPVWVIGGSVHSSKMLVAVDGSENSAKAVDHMAGYAADMGAEVTLCHVIRGDEWVFGATVFELDRDIERRLEEWRNKGLQKMFADYQMRLRAAGVKADQISVTCITRSLSRAADILKAAGDGGYGTIIMGRRGISKVREFLMGRVTTKVLNGAEGLAVWIVP
ncbi:MAG: universal stress protein [Desulforhabdus sp.]|jgi:nucleotide-binding universal stress UspA family protein|nr:universal stress protein [Desulforhabdus sp.]